MSEKDNGFINNADRALRWWVWMVLWSIAAIAVFAEPAKAADSYTTNLRIVQQVAGTNANTWGTKANAAFAMLDEAVSKVTSISLTAGNVTLTTANNATDQARSAVLVFTGTPGTTRTVTAPNLQKLYYVYNNTDGAITFGSGGGTTVSIPIAAKASIYDDGATNSVALSVISSFVATLEDDTTAAAFRTTAGGLVTLTGSESLTNKTVTAPSIGGTVTGGGTYSGITLSGNTTLPGSGQISSGGLLGIGMTPVNVLDITQTQNSGSAMSIKNASAGAAAYSEARYDNGTAVLTSGITGTGYTPAGMLRASGAYLLASGAGGLTFFTNVAQPIYFGINSAEAARLTTTGKWIVGDTTTTGNATRLQVKATGGVTEFGIGINVASVTNGTTEAIDFQNAGTIVGKILYDSGTSVSYATTSDERLKDFDVPQKDWRETILAINVRQFKWRSDGVLGFGISAQQTYRYYPFAISKPDDPQKTWSADYGKLAPLALWGVQDLYRENSALRQQIRFLASRVDDMEGTLLERARVRR